jgi:hypothetical protein
VAAALSSIVGFFTGESRPTGLPSISSLNEEETEKLTIEIIAYLNIVDKIDPRSVRHAFEEIFIDRGLTNSEVLRLLERAKWKQ